MFAPLPTPEEMSAWDAACVREIGIRAEMLMENASREALHALAEAHGPLAGRRVLLLAGPGNNGGDAIALGRHLLAAGAEPLVLHTKPKGAYKGEAGYHLRLAAAVGVPLVHTRGLDPELLPGPDFLPHIVVDGLLGTGFRGELRPDMLDFVRAVNRMAELAFVFSLDTPSGLSGHSGRPSPEAVRAHATVTFEAAKLGVAMPWAREFTGRLMARPIGIPDVVKDDLPTAHVLMTEAIGELLEPPAADLHKGSTGHVLVVGGSPGLTGAPHLCALGALRCGAGLATCACPAGVEAFVKAGSPDVMTMPLGDPAADRDWSGALARTLITALPRFDALVVGPGLGRHPGAGELLDVLLGERPAAMPTVIDADALNWLAERPELRRLVRPTDVLTPHPGEMARLLGKSIQEIQADRSAACRALSDQLGCVVLLKGAATIVAAPGEPLAVSPFGEPNLAVAGSGDVLSGVIGTLAARGLDSRPAACLGVFLHGLCGTILSRANPARGNLASDIASALPDALKELTAC